MGGRSRAVAPARVGQTAKAEGLEWVWVSDKAFADDDEALVYAIHAQSNRRNLNAAELLRCIERLQAIKGRDHDQATGRFLPKEGRAADRIGKMVGVSSFVVKQAQKVLRDDAARAAVESGEKSINAASKDVRPGRRLYRYEGRVD